MKQHIQSFSRGLNQDLSTNKYPNTNIYWAQNFRFISKDGLATGALTNVKGTSAKLNVGNSEEVILETCLIRDTLVLFVSSPEGGKIYKWEYNNTDFEESPTLIYTDPDLNFSTDHPVRAVGRYETETVQKIYFTDGYSFFKHLNIVSDSYPITYNVDSLDLVSDVDFSNIDLELVAGGDLKAGKIQYAYQLYSKRGSETTFSPTSQLIHLTTYTDSGETREYKGVDVGTSINKSVIVTIDNVDPANRELYTRLRLVALEYTTYNQIPSIRIVGEYNIENLESLVVTDSGSSIGELTLEEFRFIQNNIYPKTLDIKNDYLFAANVKHDYFYISDNDFDARAFRFNSAQECKVWNGENEVSILADWSNLPPITDESFNKFNDWNNDYLFDQGVITTYHYKYQSDGTTLGGEGPNISYKFTTERVLLDDEQIESSGFPVGNGAPAVPKMDISCSDFSNQANPLSKVGYKREETYRFAIIFRDLKGRPSFAKWIADIKMPTNKEIPFIYYDNSTNKVYADILGVEFTVDTSNISDQISGYEIVRAERTSSDKTILSQGLIGYMKDYDTDTHETDMMFSLGTMPFVNECLNKETLYELKSTTGLQPNRRYKYPGKPLTDEYMEFISPEVVVNKINYNTSNAYIVTEGFLTSATTVSTSGATVDNSSMLVADKYWEFGAGIVDRYRRPVNNYKVYTPKLRGHNSSDYSLDATLHTLPSKTFNNMCNTGDLDGSDHFRGARGTFGLVNVDSGFYISTGDTSWTNGDNNRVFLGSYRVHKGRSQYGGSTYVARASTKYYPASGYIDKDTTVSEVFNGDTYINYMWYLRSMWDINWRDETETDPGISSRSIENVIMFPVESSINLDLRTDNPQEYMNWGYPREEYNPNYKLLETTALGVASFGRRYPVDLGDLYRYNTAYSCIDKSKEYYPEPFDFEQTITNDVRIYASEKKINGEYTDSWTKFLFNNYIDVDSKHNAITKILTFKNNLFFIQPTAVGIASVNQRSLISDNNPGELVVGTGGILERYDYITDKSGSEYYDAILASDDFLFYADGRRKRINKLVPGKEEAISVIKGIDSTLDKLSWENVIGGFDRGYNEVLFSIDGTTIAFSEMADAFMSAYSFSPGKMISIGKDFFSTGPGSDDDESPWLYADGALDKVGYSGDTSVDLDWDYILIGPGSEGASGVLYKHNVGDPGVFYNSSGADDSYLTLIINPEGNKVCYFDNLDLRTESTLNSVDDPEDIFYRLEASNNYQEITRELNFALNQSSGHTGSIKRIGRVWRTPIVSASSNKRMVDTYLKVTLRYNNTGNTFRLHDVGVLYRPANH